MIRILLTLIVFVTVSCKNKHEIPIASNESFDLSDFDEFLVSEPILDLQEYIVLETNEKSLIGSVDKLLIAESRIYILDWRNTQKLFVFDLNGAFIQTIGSQGNGVGEYSFLMDFDVDTEGNIHILDARIPEVIVYNSEGNLLRSKRFNSFYASALKHLGDGDYVFRRKRMASNKQEDLDYNLIHWNMEKGIVKKYLTDRNVLDWKSFPNFTYPEISGGVNSALFYRPFDYNFFSVNKSGIQLVYSLDFDNRKILPAFFDQNMKPREIMSKLIGSGKYFGISNYFDTNFFFTCCFQAGNESFLFVYNKSSNDFLVKRIRDISKDEQYAGIRPHFALEDNLYGVIFPEQIERIKKNIQNKTSLELIKKSKLEFVSDLSDFQNPIIVNYRFETTNFK